MDSSRWLVLLHSLPPKPPYLRAKVMRRLTQLGALALKRSVYLLPSTESGQEDFQWLLKEIRQEGGDGWVLESHFLGGLTDQEVRENFRAIRRAAYAGLAVEVRALLDRMREIPRESQPDLEWKRLRRRIDAERQLDFFHAEGRNELEALMSAVDRLIQPSSDPANPLGPDELQARTWVTRAGVKVDRIASAWLIRRFIDPAASFAFVGPDDPSQTNAIRFDMFEGEFTHDGDRCTFEVLRDVCGHASDPALVAIGQIVHDIDLRDDRYQRVETAGVAALIDGIVARFDDDHRRLAEGASLFEGLYATLGDERQRAGRAQ